MADGALAVAMRSACGLVAATAAFQQLCATADPVVALTHCRWPLWDLREAAAAGEAALAVVAAGGLAFAGGEGGHRVG